MTPGFEAQALAWIDAWNAHDLDRIMEHYADDVVFQAPTVVRRWGRADGRLHGSTELREHFRRGLELAPRLRFDFEAFFEGPQGYVILYRRDNGNRAVDVVQVDSAGRALDVRAYYASPQS